MVYEDIYVKSECSMQHDLQINIPIMDKIHDEFEYLLEELKECDSQDFFPLFEEMIEHTKDHFALEEELMVEYGFYGIHEHFTEHQNILNEMEYFYRQAQKLPFFGKSYINEYASDKFKRHVSNIDSQLAMFLKEQKFN